MADKEQIVKTVTIVTPLVGDSTSPPPNGLVQIMEKQMWIIYMVNKSGGLAFKVKTSKKYKTAEKWVDKQDLPDGYEYIIALKTEEK